MTSQLSVLAFPCNQFGHQEPGKNATEILAGLKYVRPGGGYTPHRGIVMMGKSDINGPEESAVYAYLKESCPQPITSRFNPRENFWDPIKPTDVTWNFEKFLVSTSGVPMFRFTPLVEPFDLIDLLSALQSPDDDFKEEQLAAILKKIDDVIDKRESKVKH